MVGYSPWGRKESDTTERFHFHSHYDYAGSLLLCSFSPVAVSRGYSLVTVEGLLIVVGLVVWSMGFRVFGHQELGHMGSVVAAPRL